MLTKTTNKLSSFFKNLGIKLLDYFKSNWIKLLIIFLLLASLTIFIVSVVTKKSPIYRRDPYDKTGFVQKEDYNKDEITLSNSRFEFVLDTANTHFSIKDTRNNKVWNSHAKGDVSSMTNELRELFTIYYERTLEAPKSMSVNMESIRHDKYAFRIDKDSVEVLYTVGGKHGLTMEDLPQRISPERFEEKITPNLEAALKEDSSLRRDIRLFQNQYILVETANERYYVLKSFSSNDAIATIHRILFEVGGYTDEDFIEDSILYGFEVNPEPMVFEFAVKYTLTDEGLDFKLINESIYEPSTHELAYIDILPYFGSGDLDTSGQIMIPDGSGVLLDYNNDKYDAPVYNKRIYGRDYANRTTTSRIDDGSEDILMPLYGVNDEGSSFIHLIDEGASMSYLRAGFKTQLMNSSLVSKVPYAHYRYYLRERDSYMFSGVGYDQQVTVWTEDYNKEDFSSKFIFIDKDQDQSYVGMASVYQKHLVANGTLVKNDNKKNEAIFNLTLLGGYVDRDYFLGIPYNTVKSLTNIKEAEIIIDELIDENIKNLNVNYQGWSNEGLKPSYSSKIKFDKKVGKSKEFRKVAQKYANKEGVNFIPEIFVQTSFGDKNIKLKKDVIYDMFWENISYQSFNLSSMVPDRNSKIIYPINSEIAADSLTKVTKTFNKNKFNAIAFSDYGNQLNSSFNKDNLIFRNDSIEFFTNSMDKIRDDYEYISMRTPHQYAIKYADNLNDLPTKGTEYRIIDRSVPFVQLVLSGFVDYSTTSFNLDDGKSQQYHKLKAIETGSNINFTWSYNDTISLVDTEYSNYYSSYYKNWFEEAVTIYHELNDLNIYSAKLINHKVLNSSGSKIVVDYSNGLSIRIDYDNLSYEVVRG